MDGTSNDPRERSGLALKKGNAIRELLEGHDPKKILKYLGLAEKVQSIEHQIIVFVFIENMQENVCL